MKIISAGINHHSASLDIREKLNFSSGRSAEFLADFQDKGLIETGVLLSTCARTELYFTAGKNLTKPQQPLLELCWERNFQFPTRKNFIQIKNNSDAVEHLLRVTTGLDSLILGETEITGQVKEAYNTARNAETCGRYLHRLFQTALRAASDVHSLPRSQAYPHSIGETTVQLVQNELNNIADSAILVLGLGRVGKLCLSNLLEYDPDRLYITGRERQLTERKAQKFGGRALDYSQLNRYLGRSDLIITATSSPNLILRKKQLEQTLDNRRLDEPLLIIDLAVPRDVEPEVGELPGVNFFNVDQLKNINYQEFSQTDFYQQARSVVDNEKQKFDAWLKTQRAAPLFKQLKHYFQEQSRQVLAANEDLDSPQNEENLEKISVKLTEKLLNRPLRNYRHQLQAGDGRQSTEVLSQLFELPNPLAED